MKKILAVLLSLAMCGSVLIGCGNKNSDNDSDKQSDNRQNEESNDAENTDNEGESESQEPDISEFVELTFLTYGDAPQGDWIKTVEEEFNKILKEKLNCNLTFEFIGSSEWETKYNMLLTSGEGLDLILSGTWMGLWDLAPKGAFYDLKDLLPTYAPYLYETRDPETWEAATYEGQVICVPETEYANWGISGIGYRLDWAKEAGFEDGINSFDDLTQYFYYVKETYPDINPIAMESSTNGLFYHYRDAFSSHVLTSAGIGPCGIFTINGEGDYTIVSDWFEDIYVDFAILMKEWADAGFFMNDVLNATGISTNKLFWNGESAVYGGHLENFVTGGEYDFEKNKSEADAEMGYFCTSDMNDTPPMMVDPTNGAICVSAFSENPERALMVIDLLYSDQDFYRLVHYGIEGINYSLDENGCLVAQDTEEYPSEDYTYYSNVWGGRTDRFEVAKPWWSANKDEVYNAVNERAMSFQWPGFTFIPDDVSSEIAAMNNAMATYGAAIAFGQVDDPEAAVEELREALMDAGYETVKAELQKQVDEWSASR